MKKAALAGLLLAAGLVVASEVDITPVTVPITVSKIDIKTVREDPDTGTWHISAEGVTTNTVVMEDGCSRFVNIVIECDVTRADIAAHYGVTTNEYDDLTVKQLRDGVNAVGISKSRKVLGK